MQQYFVKTSQIATETVRIIGDDVKHISKVMRMKLGDKVIVSNEVTKYICEIIKIDNQTVDLHITDEMNEISNSCEQVIIMQSLLKGDKLDTVIQKGTELGASEFILFESKRSVVKWDESRAIKKLNRLNKIAKEAAEQSKRLKYPRVKYFKNINEIISNEIVAEYKFIAYEGASSESKLHKFSNEIKKCNPSKKIAFVIGPEGGFDFSEVEKFNQNDYHTITLGKRILRAETAPLYCLSVMNYVLES